MSWVEQINQTINGFVWGPIMLALLVGVGVFYTIRLKGFQISKIGVWVRGTFGALFRKKNAGDGAVTPFQAMTTALAATVGTGNMVGVATAMVAGGPGAIFWMWVSAFFGMMTKYSEIVLSVHYRRRNAKGDWVGGPMYYISEGLGKNFAWLAVLFAVFGSLAAFGIGNMSQINSIATSLEVMMVELGALPAIAPDGTLSIFKLGVGIVVAIIAALVIIGGIKRIGQVTEKVVPFMSLFYVIGAIVVLIMNRENLGRTFGSIFENAFNFKAAAGGVGGYTIAQAMRFGVARGVFSNEAGLGSAPIAHAAADTENPVKQGIWGIFEVFVDTLVICTMTALVVLSSGMFVGTDSLQGSQLTIAAYSSSFGLFGVVFITVSITLFAFTTLLSWSLYGQRCFEYLFKGKGLGVYRIIFVACIVFSAVMKLGLAWDISDTLNGLMAIPNLIGLCGLSGIVVKRTREYLRDRKTGGVDAQALQK